MKKLEFKASTLEECIENACEHLNIGKENLAYTVMQEKKGLFRKSISIMVEVPEIKEAREENGKVKIEQGKLIVKNPKEGGVPARISKGANLRIYIDGEEIEKKTEVYAENVIDIQFEKSTATRTLNLTISPNKLEAYSSIEYIPQNVYELIEVGEEEEIVVECKVKEQVYPPKYKVQELKEELSKKGIVYGIINENIIKCVEETQKVTLLIAKGRDVIHGTDDFIEVKFNVEKNDNNFEQDNKGTVDFKSIGYVNSIKKGDTVAVKVPGNEGEDGNDIFGTKTSHRVGKKLVLRVGEGCVLQDENTVVALRGGKPSMKNNAFCIYELHEVKGDVDLKSGNIKFVGDIIIQGSIKEGMEVDSGNNIEIMKDVERSKITAKGNVSIRGNSILAKINAGGEDVSNLKQIQDLQNLKTAVDSLFSTIEEVKKYNLLGYKTTDGEIVKVLIENKFKIIPKLCLNVISDIAIRKKEGVIPEDTMLLQLIKEKLIGLGPLSIKSYFELEEILNKIHERVEKLKGSLSIPVNVILSYCQDSDISSTGDITITGKGEYVSNLTANNGIYFMDTQSVTRGGVLKARNEIKCKTVGSTGSVATRLIVSEKGHIWADVAYQNTIFVVGEREFNLEIASKNIHAYSDDREGLVVDRFKL